MPSNDDQPDDGEPSEFLASGKFYGDTEFNPKEIVIQIILIQSAYYAILSGLVLIVYSTLSRPRRITTLFDATHFTWAHGKAMSVMTLLAGICISFCVSPVVERGRKCLDFVATLHINHIILCWCLVGFPKTGLFWGVHIFAAAMTTYLSEYLCSKSELQEIVLHKRTSSTHNSTVLSTVKASALSSHQPLRTRPTEPSSSSDVTALELQHFPSSTRAPSVLPPSTLAAPTLHSLTVVAQPTVLGVPTITSGMPEEPNPVTVLTQRDLQSLSFLSQDARQPPLAAVEMAPPTSP